MPDPRSVRANESVEITAEDLASVRQQRFATPSVEQMDARREWFRQMRLQSAVFAMQLNVRSGTPDGSTVVADAEKIFEFLTKEDVH